MIGRHVDAWRNGLATRGDWDHEYGRGGVMDDKEGQKWGEVLWVGSEVWNCLYAFHVMLFLLISQTRPTSSLYKTDFVSTQTRERERERDSARVLMCVLDIIFFYFFGFFQMFKFNGLWTCTRIICLMCGASIWFFRQYELQLEELNHPFMYKSPIKWLIHFDSHIDGMTKLPSVIHMKYIG